MTERKYKLLQDISTPFGSWSAGSVKTEAEWRAIAPNGEHLVPLVDNKAFEPVLDKAFEVWPEVKACIFVKRDWGMKEVYQDTPTRWQAEQHIAALKEYLTLIP